MRSLIAVACAFLAGLLLPVTLSPGSRATLAIASLSAGLLLTTARGLRVPGVVSWAGSWLLAPAALAAGVAFGSPAQEPLVLVPAGLARLWVQVADVSHLEPGRGLSHARVLHGERLQDRAAVLPGTRLTLSPYALPEGATVQLIAKLQPRVPFRNPSPHTPLASARTSHAHAVMPGRDAYRVIEHTWPARWLWRARSWVRHRLDATLTPEVAAVARALTLGDPDALSDDDQTAVRGSGLAHVFAVSGMHVTLLAGCVVLALTRALAWLYPIASRWDTRRIAAALGIPCALAIGAFTGAAPSGVRAALTSALAWALCACGRRPAPAAVAALTSLVFGALWPSDALRPAFLLSIAATAAIVSEPHAPVSTLSDALRSAGRLSLRTMAATAPIVVWTFGALPLVGVLANLLFVPVGSLLLVLAVFHACCACAAPAAAWLTALPLHVTSRAFLRGCEWFAALDPQLRLPVLSDAQGVLLVIAVCVGLFAQRWRGRRLAWIALVLGVAAAEWQLRWSERPHDVLRASFIDVGQGDATLIDLPNGRCMLVDAGGSPQGGPDPGARALVPLLQARRRDHLDVVVLSHPHPDHYGGLGAVLDAVTIGEVWDTGQAQAEAERSASSLQASQWLERARRKGARVRGPAELCDREHALGGARVEVLWPCPSFDAGRDPNDNSLVLRVAYGEQALLLAGDIEAHAEAGLLANPRPLRASVLKVAHHGSATSSSLAFLRAVSPQLAIVSAGAVNPFGHPNPEVMQRLRGNAARVVELGRSGGAQVRTDGHSLELATWAE